MIVLFRGCRILYNYPFIFSDSLLYFQNKSDLIVKLEIIQVFSTNSLEKRVHLKKLKT